MKLMTVEMYLIHQTREKIYLFFLLCVSSPPPTFRGSFHFPLFTPPPSVLCVCSVYLCINRNNPSPPTQNTRLIMDEPLRFTPPAATNIFFFLVEIVSPSVRMRKSNRIFFGYSLVRQARVSALLLFIPSRYRSAHPSYLSIPSASLLWTFLPGIF